MCSLGNSRPGHGEAHCGLTSCTLCLVFAPLITLGNAHQNCAHLWTILLRVINGCQSIETMHSLSCRLYLWPTDTRCVCVCVCARAHVMRIWISNVSASNTVFLCRQMSFLPCCCCCCFDIDVTCCFSAGVQVGFQLASPAETFGWNGWRDDHAERMCKCLVELGRGPRQWSWQSGEPSASNAANALQDLASSWKPSPNWSQLWVPRLEYVIIQVRPPPAHRGPYRSLDAWKCSKNSFFETQHCSLRYG